MSSLSSLIKKIESDDSLKELTQQALLAKQIEDENKKKLEEVLRIPKNNTEILDSVVINFRRMSEEEFNQTKDKIYKSLMEKGVEVTLINEILRTFSETLETAKELQKKIDKIKERVVDGSGSKEGIEVTEESSEEEEKEKLIEESKQLDEILQNLGQNWKERIGELIKENEDITSLFFLYMLVENNGEIRKIPHFITIKNAEYPGGYKGILKEILNKNSIGNADINALFSGEKIDLGFFENELMNLLSKRGYSDISTSSANNPKNEFYNLRNIFMEELMAGTFEKYYVDFFEKTEIYSAKKLSEEMEIQVRLENNKRAIDRKFEEKAS